MPEARVLLERRGEHHADEIGRQYASLPAMSSHAAQEEQDQRDELGFRLAHPMPDLVEEPARKSRQKPQADRRRRGKRREPTL